MKKEVLICDICGSQMNKKIGFSELKFAYRMSENSEVFNIRLEDICLSCTEKLIPHIKDLANGK